MIIYCPHCHQDFEVEINWIGKKVNCTNCNRDFTVSKPVICPTCKTPNPITTPDCLNCQNPLRSRDHLPVSQKFDCNHEDFSVEKPGLDLRFCLLLTLETIAVFFPLELLILKLDISLMPKLLFFAVIFGIRHAIIKLTNIFCPELEDFFHSIFVGIAGICAIATGLLTGYGVVSLIFDSTATMIILFLLLPITLIYLFIWVNFARFETQTLVNIVVMATPMGGIIGLICNTILYGS